MICRWMSWSYQDLLAAPADWVNQLIPELIDEEARRQRQR